MPPKMNSKFEGKICFPNLNEGTPNISLEKLKVFEFFPRRIHRPHSDSENNNLLRAFSVLVIRKELSKTLSYKLIYKPLHNTEAMLQCIHLYFRKNDSISGKPTFKTGKVDKRLGAFIIRRQS